MIGCMFTSLKVVSMAVVFFASTRRRLTVFRRLLIFSVFSSRLNNSMPGFFPGCVSASSTSSFKIFPPIPDGLIVDGFNFLSAIIAEATGVAFTSCSKGVSLDWLFVIVCWSVLSAFAGSAFVSFFFLSGSLPYVSWSLLPVRSRLFASFFTVPFPPGLLAVSSIFARTCPIFKVSPS